MLKVIAEFVQLNAAVSKMCVVLEVGQKEDLTFWGQLEKSFNEKISASRRLVRGAKSSSTNEGHKVNDKSVYTRGCPQLM